MIVTVNGQRRTVADGLTLSVFVQAEVGSARGTAVAVDSEVIPRAEWPVFEIRADSALEILNAVQGG